MSADRAMENAATPTGMNRGRWKYVVPAVLAMVAGVAVLYAFSPERYGFYPKCLLKTVTGWDCPGCGGLRAAHHFLHGRFGEALRLNPFLAVAGLWGVAVGVVEVYRWKRRSAMDNPLRRARVLWAMALLMVAFGIARNFASHL